MASIIEFVPRQPLTVSPLVGTGRLGSGRGRGALITDVSAGGIGRLTSGQGRGGLITDLSLASIARLTAGRGAGVLSTVSGGSFPNEPVGAIPVSDAVPLMMTLATFAETFPETAAQPFFSVINGNTENVTDPTAPVHTGENEIGRVLFVDGNVNCPTGGNSAAVLSSGTKLVPPGNAVIAYDHFYLRVSGSDPRIYVNGLKISNAFNGASSTSILELGEGFPGEPATWEPPWVLKFIGQDGILSPTICTTAPLIQVDFWHEIETRINYNTKEHHIYIDRVLRAQGTNTAAMGSPGEFQLSYVFGGGPCQSSGMNFHLYHDEYYRSYTA